MFWLAGFTPEAGAVRRKRIAAAPASRRSLAPLDSGSIFKPKMLPYTGVTATCSPGDFMSVSHLFRSGFCVALACLALFPLPASAAPSVSEVTAKTQAAYKALNDFRAEFTQELTHQESGTTETRTGTLLFRKPLLVRWESVPPHAELLLVGERDIWNWLPDEELAYRYSLDMVKDSRSLIAVLTGQSPLDRDFDVEFMNETPAGEDAAKERAAGTLDAVHLLLYPRDPSPQMVEVQLWIDARSGFIRRAQVMDFYGNTNRITFTDFRPDERLSARDFTFTPPKGTEVEDHRNDGSAPGSVLLK